MPLLLVVVLALGWLAVPAQAKDYFFPRVDIDAQVNPDGSTLITERRAYRFNGAFSWATYTLERRGWTDITDVSIADDGGRYHQAASEAPRTYQVAMSPKEMEVKWFFRAEDEEKTFTIRYRAVGVVTRYRDTAELFWRFVGTGWADPTDRVHVSVRIPGASQAELRAWGHGPLNGVVALRDGAVTLDVENLDGGTFVEARLLFPRRLVPEAPVRDEDALPRILNEEARWARQANLERLTPWLNLLLFPIAIGGALVAWLILYLRHGKEHRIRLEQSYLREPPATYPPAILGALMRWGTPNGQDFAATILDLARRGFLTIQQEGKDGSTYRFIGTGKSENGLPDSDHRALSLLFRGGPNRDITDRQFRDQARRSNDGARLFKEWQRAVETEARAHNFFDAQSRRIQQRLGSLFALIAGGGVVLTIVAMVGFRIWLVSGFFAFPLAGVLLLILRGPITRRSVDGATHLAQWRAFRRFLTDFSTLEDAPPAAITVWEMYLPYAVTLGVAERVIRQFPKAYPDAAAQPAPSWYVSPRGLTGSSRGGVFADIASMSRAFSRTVAAATSPPSSSSGSGGGFSRGSSSSSGGSRGGGGSGGRAG